MRTNPYRIFGVALLPCLIILMSLTSMVEAENRARIIAQERAEIAYRKAREDIVRAKYNALVGLTSYQNEVLLNRVKWRETP